MIQTIMFYQPHQFVKFASDVADDRAVSTYSKEELLYKTKNTRLQVLISYTTFVKVSQVVVDCIDKFVGFREVARQKSLQ